MTRYLSTLAVWLPSEVDCRRAGRGKLDNEMSDSLGSTIGHRSGPYIEQEHGKKETTETLADIQGTGGAGSDERRQDARRVGVAVQPAPQSDHRLEDAVDEMGDPCVPRSEGRSGAGSDYVRATMRLRQG